MPETKDDDNPNQLVTQSWRPASNRSKDKPNEKKDMHLSRDSKDSSVVVPMPDKQNLLQEFVGSMKERLSERLEKVMEQEVNRDVQVEEVGGGKGGSQCCSSFSC